MASNKKQLLKDTRFANKQNPFRKDSLLNAITSLPKESKSSMGYRDDSPYKNEPYIDIHTPTGVIDMSDTGVPIMANGRVLPPYSGEHQFDTDTVREIPLAQKGGEIMELDDAEIEEYRRQGYIIEDYQAGGDVEKSEYGWDYKREGEDYFAKRKGDQDWIKAKAGTDALSAIKEQVYGDSPERVQSSNTTAQQVSQVRNNPNSVRDLQIKLKNAGYDLGNFGPDGSGIDGRMGKYTIAALEAYNNNISPDRAMGPQQGTRPTTEPSAQEPSQSSVQNPITDPIEAISPSPTADVLQAQPAQQQTPLTQTTSSTPVEETPLDKEDLKQSKQLKREEVDFSNFLSKEDYQNKIKNNYSSYVESQNNTTPYYIDPVEEAENTTRMNCINGVCTIISNLTQQGFKGGRAEKKLKDGVLSNDYISNQKFSGKTLNKEGYYAVTPTHDMDFAIGDILQWSHFKETAPRFEGEVTEKNKKDLVPGHALTIADSKVELVNGKEVKKYLVVDNKGLEAIREKWRSEDELKTFIQKGVGTFDGMLVNRYDPEKAKEEYQADDEFLNAINGNSPFKEEYDNSSYKAPISDDIKDKSPNINKLAESLEKNYAELGSKSGLPKNIFDKLYNAQVGIAAQESDIGDDQGGFAEVADPIVPQFAVEGGRWAKQTARDLVNDKYSWLDDYWNKNVDNVQEENKGSFENFKKQVTSEFNNALVNEQQKKDIDQVKSYGMFQQKEVSRLGKALGVKREDLSAEWTPDSENIFATKNANVDAQVRASVALAVDNYRALKKKYKDKFTEDEYIDLTITSHNKPGLTFYPRYAEYYAKHKDLTYANKVKDKSDIISNYHSLGNSSNLTVEEIVDREYDALKSKRLAESRRAEADVFFKSLSDIPEKEIVPALPVQIADSESTYVSKPLIMQEKPAPIPKQYESYLGPDSLLYSPSERVEEEQQEEVANPEMEEAIAYFNDYLQQLLR